MASAPGSRPPVQGRVNRKGVLVEADPPLLRLQTEAGAGIGAPLALPQLAAVARAAQKLGVPLSRSVLAASAEHDLDLWVRAEPDSEGVSLFIEGWNERPPTPPRLTLVAGGKLAEAEHDGDPRALRFEVDAELRFTQISPSLAPMLGGDNLIGEPLTRHFLLTENESGLMPMLMALGARTDFADQRAEIRGPQPGKANLSGKALTRRGGRFAGFDISVALDQPIGQDVPDALFDPAIDGALRTPLDQIITAADRIVQRSDGPLRSDYANYASDIAAAGRHLMSVLRSMNEEETPAQPAVVDTLSTVAEAVSMVAADAKEKSVEIAVEDVSDLPAVSGEARAVLQILVNLLGNAVRHSPEGKAIDVRFQVGDKRINLIVADQGPGIAAADQDRIFERYEQGERPGSAGLGLAISRRLARSMGGDVLVESARGQGARFMLVLPRA